MNLCWKKIHFEDYSRACVKIFFHHIWKNNFSDFLKNALIFKIRYEKCLNLLRTFMKLCELIEKNTLFADMSLRYVPRRSWSTEERNAGKRFFMEEIKTCYSPSMEKCRLAVNTKQELKLRTPTQIRTWITNLIRHNKQSSNKLLNLNTCIWNHVKVSVLGYKRRSWSTPEKQLCRQIFGQYVEKGIYPSREKMSNVLKVYSAFQNRTPSMVVSHLQHVMNTKKKS